MRFFHAQQPPVCNLIVHAELLIVNCAGIIILQAYKGVQLIAIKVAVIAATVSEPEVNEPTIVFFLLSNGSSRRSIEGPRFVPFMLKTY